MAVVRESSAEAFAQLAIALHDGPSLAETVETVVEFALQATGADHAGVILVHGRNRIETSAVTDPVVRSIDDLQMSLGEGPDLEVLQQERTSLMIPDIALETRWPTWAKQVSAIGIRSLLSTRMYTTETTVGTLNLYARAPDAFDLDDQAVAHVLARHAAVALATARNEANLWQAVDARKRIGQAQGILMERFDLTDDQAFEVLRRYSQDQNIKLRAVADLIVETRALPEP